MVGGYTEDLGKNLGVGTCQDNTVQSLLVIHCRDGSVMQSQVLFVFTTIAHVVQGEARDPHIEQQNNQSEQNEVCITEHYGHIIALFPNHMYQVRNFGSVITVVTTPSLLICSVFV